MDCIVPLPAMLKGFTHALTFISLLTSYLITVPLKTKTADEVSMVYMKKVLPKISCPKFIIQDSSTKLNNEQLMSVFHSLSIKCMYSNAYYPKGNSRIENTHNFLKHAIAMFAYDSQLEWDDSVPLATYCYNIAPCVDDLESPFYLVDGRDPLEGRLSMELRKLQKLHAKLLTENRVTNPTNDRKITKASDLK